MSEAKADLDEEFAPLDIKCTDTDCENNLHCFQKNKKSADPHPTGTCRECGANLVNWSRVHIRNLKDTAHTFEMLNKELIRHRYWHTPIDQRAVNHAKRKGRAGIRTAAEAIIRKKIAPKEPPYDGRQTSKTGNVICYAQHAVAACCRKCVEEWHAIPMSQKLTEEQVAYLTELVCLYIHQRLPQLAENGEKVPPIRKKKLLSRE